MYKKMQPNKRTPAIIAINHHTILPKTFIRSSTGGGGFNKFEKQPTLPFALSLNGLTMYKWAVALLAASKGSWSDEIFFSAEIKPDGCLVMATEPASAVNSRRLEIASCISRAMIGESSAKITPITIIRAANWPEFLLRLPLTLTRKKKSPKRATVPTKTATILASLIS